MLPHHSSQPFVIELARQACTACLDVAKKARPVGDLRSQLERAAVSFALNTAEAMGREGKDRRRVLRLAYGSVLEAKVALQIVEHTSGVDVSKALGLSDHLAAVLYRMAR